jgi:hypothetical protein
MDPMIVKNHVLRKRFPGEFRMNSRFFSRDPVFTQSTVDKR